jgi:hypothetical protein
MKFGQMEGRAFNQAEIFITIETLNQPENVDGKDTYFSLLKA